MLDDSYNDWSYQSVNLTKLKLGLAYKCLNFKSIESSTNSKI